MGANGATGKDRDGKARLGGAWLGPARHEHGDQWSKDFFKKDGKMYEKLYRVELKGISPLVMHWDNIDWCDQIAAKRDEIKKTDKAKFTAGDDRCPPDTWKGYAYNDGEHIVLPTDNIRSALMKAGARIILSKSKTFKELSQCGILFVDPFLKLDIGDNPKAPVYVALSDVDAIEGKYVEHVAAARKLGFELFAKRAAVGQAKHVRVRPMFRQWRIDGQFIVTDKQLSLDILQQMFDVMGYYIGICDWRPGSPKSPGPYGRFEAKVSAI